MGRKQEAIGIYDLAKQMNMSASTISRALNGQAGVSAKRALEIRKIADSMGYHPTPYHRKSSSCLALFLPENTFSDEQFTRRIIHSAEQYASKLKKYLFLCFAPPDSKKLPDLLTSRRVDGVLLAQHPPRAWVNMIREYNLPVVAIGDLTARLGCDCVIGNPLNGSAALAQRLIKGGHRNFSLIVTDRNYPTVERRFKAIEDVLKDYDIEIDPEMVITHTPSTIKGGTEAVNYLFKNNKRPDVIIFTNDWSAIGGFIGLVQQQLKVPDDISIASFDNSFVCEEIIPSLTTVDLQIQTIVQTAIDRLIALIENENDCRSYSQIEIESKLVWRDSCRDKIN